MSTAYTAYLAARTTLTFPVWVDQQRRAGTLPNFTKDTASTHTDTYTEPPTWKQVQASREEGTK